MIESALLALLKIALAALILYSLKCIVSSLWDFTGKISDLKPKENQPMRALYRFVIVHQAILFLLVIVLVFFYGREPNSSMPEYIQELLTLTSGAPEIMKLLIMWTGVWYIKDVNSRADSFINARIWAFATTNLTTDVRAGAGPHPEDIV